MANTNIVPQGLFGPGILYITRTDIANSTPVNVGFCQEFSYDLAYTTKELYGQNQFPLLVARGTAKATGKIKAAAVSGNALNAVLWGGSFTAGTQYDTAVSPSTAIPTTPFHITPTVPSSGTWNSDLGVTNAATGQAFTLTTGTPSAGQYAVAAGVYTFASADNVSGISVIISFSYSYTTAPGQYIIAANQLIGNTPTFQIDYKTILYGATYFVRFYNAICTKVSMAHKLEDYAMPEIDFGFFVNAAGNLYLVSLAAQA